MITKRKLGKNILHAHLSRMLSNLPLAFLELLPLKAIVGEYSPRPKDYDNILKNSEHMVNNFLYEYGSRLKITRVGFGTDSRG